MAARGSTLRGWKIENLTSFNDVHARFYIFRNRWPDIIWHGWRLVSEEEEIRTKSNQTDSTTRQEPDRRTKWIANISELHFFPRRYVLANHKAIKTMPDHIWQTKSSPQPYLRARLLIHGRCFLQLAFFISPTYGFSCLFAPSLILRVILRPWNAKMRWQTTLSVAVCSVSLILSVTSRHG